MKKKRIIAEILFWVISVGILVAIYALVPERIATEALEWIGITTLAYTVGYMVTRLVSKVMFKK